MTPRSSPAYRAIYPHALAFVFRAERERSGLSQKQVCAQAAIPQVQLSRIEIGIRLVVPTDDCKTTALFARVAPTLGSTMPIMVAKAAGLTAQTEILAKQLRPGFPAADGEPQLARALVVLVAELAKLDKPPERTA